MGVRHMLVWPIFMKQNSIKYPTFAPYTVETLLILLCFCRWESVQKYRSGCLQYFCLGELVKL